MSHSPEGTHAFSDTVASPSVDHSEEGPHVTSPIDTITIGDSSPIQAAGNRSQTGSPQIEVLIIEDTPSPEREPVPTSPKYSPSSPDDWSDGEGSPPYEAQASSQEMAIDISGSPPAPGELIDPSLDELTDLPRLLREDNSSVHSNDSDAGGGPQPDPQSVEGNDEEMDYDLAAFSPERPSPSPAPTEPASPPTFRDGDVSQGFHQLPIQPIEHRWEESWLTRITPTAADDNLAQLVALLGLGKERLEEEENSPSTPVPTSASTPATKAPLDLGERHSFNNTIPLASHMHMTPPSTNTSIVSGDIIVDVPTHATGWDFTETRPVPDRYDPTWLAQVPREKRPFILVPVNPKSKVALPIEAIQTKFNAFSASIQLRTLQGYGGSIYRAIKWLINSGWKPEDILPMDDSALMSVLGVHVGVHRVCTAERTLSALKWWHALHGFELVAPKAEWRILRNGCKALQPPATKLRPPVTMSDLKFMISHLNVTGDGANPHDIAFKACILTTFHAMARLRETTSAKVGSPALGYSPTRDDVTFFPSTRSTPARATIRIPYDKVRKTAGRELIIVSQSADPSMCPLLALQDHLRVNVAPSSMGLFTYMEDKEPHPWRQMTHSWVINHSNALLARGGFPPINGHSFRFGGATYYLTMRVNSDIVKSIGGWASDSFLRYWRNQSLIAGRTMADLELETDNGTEIPASVVLGDDEDEDDYDESVVDVPSTPPPSSIPPSAPSTSHARSLSPSADSGPPSKRMSTRSVSSKK
ncbi:hypothetical protein P7C70_g4108, partial [Phenoliferia sp. Uapishka_3]